MKSEFPFNQTEFTEIVRSAEKIYRNRLFSKFAAGAPAIMLRNSPVSGSFRRWLQISYQISAQLQGTYDNEANFILKWQYLGHRDTEKLVMFKLTYG